MRPRLQLLPCLLGALVAAACGRPVHLVDADRTAVLHAGLVGAEGVEIHATASLVAVAEHAARAVRARGELDAVVVPFGGQSDEGRPRLLFGRVDEPSITVLLSPLGFEVAGGGFEFVGRDFDGAADGVVLVAPDPERPGLPVTVVAANDVASLARAWRLLVPSWRPGLWVLRDGHVEVALELAGRWPSRLVVTEDRAAPWRAAEHSWSALERGGVRLLAAEGAGVAPRLTRYLAAAEFARQRALAWTGAAVDEVVVEAVVHGDAASMERLFGRVELGSLAPVGEGVHVLSTPEFEGDGGRAIAEAAVLAALGEPAQPWLLEGLGVFASRRWWGQALDDWLVLLHGGGLASTVLDLTDAAPVAIDGAAARLSPHRLGPQRGALFRYLLERDGPEKMRALWRGETELVVDEELELGFHAALEALHAERGAALEQARLARYGRARELRDVRGVRLIPPRATDGLLTAEGSRALADLSRLGANAVLLPVLAYEYAPRAEQPTDPLGGGGAWPDEYAADRRDVELFLFAREARGRGFTVALSPDLLRSASTGLAAHDLKLVSVEHWTDLLVSYARFIEHYALLGELAGVQILSLGTELGRATASQTDAVDPLPEDPKQRERVLARLDPIQRAAALKASADAELENLLSSARVAGWSHIVRLARQIFSGLLSYSATWTGERQRVGFWPLLDVVGTVWFPRIDVEAAFDGAAPDRAGNGPRENAPAAGAGGAGAGTAGPGDAGTRGPGVERGTPLESVAAPELELLVKNLTAQLANQVASARRIRRGLLVMGVGFPGTEASWGDPRLRRGATDPEARALFLGALALALERTRRDQSAFIGSFLWAWPVSAAESAALGRAHVLDGPAARAALPAVFGRP